MYTFSQIAAFCDGKLVGNLSLANLPVHFLLEIDTRKITEPARSVFFALQTATRSGETYVGDAYRAGVRYFVVSESFEHMSDYPEAVFVVTQNALNALQSIAANHRNHIHKPVLAITGSNGKTIVKEWLHAILSPDIKIERSPGSYNSQVGVPLSVWKLSNSMDWGIVEAGISKPGEMSRLKEIIQPTVGLLTNIGTAHIENFGQKSEILNEKLKLFTDVNLLIYGKDDPWVHQHVTEFAAHHSIRLFSWGLDEKADLQVRIDEKDSGFTTILCKNQNLNVEFQIPFKDKAAIQNALHCIAFTIATGLFHSKIPRRMEWLTPVEMRLQHMKGVNNCTIINDAYSSDLQSVKVALETLFEVPGKYSKTVILSDIPQHGDDLEPIYTELATLLKIHGVSRCILIGKSISKFSHLFDGEVIVFHSTEHYLREFSIQNFRDEIILIKGARAFGFERIAHQLELKSHETVLEIHQSAIIHNLNVYKSLVPKGTKIMAMVKAFSYGTGGIEMASLLEFNKIDYLAVAFADEGVELRNAGIKTPIMVMSPELPAIHKMIQYQLEPEIFSFRSLDFLIRAWQEQSHAQVQPVAIHIKIDTGMHRLGFDLADVPALCEKLLQNPQITVQSVFSHLAASESPEYDEFTHLQFNRLTEAANLIRQTIKKNFLVHLLNSSGIERFPRYCLDMVRLGIGIYGCDASAKLRSQLKPALKWKSVISMIKTLEPGETVGYGRRGKITSKSRIATIPVGYADGYRRSMGNGMGKVEMNGILCPTVGNICMDMMMVDVSATEAKEGDEVILFGGSQSIEDFAQTSATIPYEVLTSIAPRVKRVYLKGD